MPQRTPNIGSAAGKLSVSNVRVPEDLVGHLAKGVKKNKNNTAVFAVNRVLFVIHQIRLGWKTYRYYYETDELPNPRPTQHKKKY